MRDRMEAIGGHGCIESRPRRAPASSDSVELTGESDAAADPWQRPEEEPLKPDRTAARSTGPPRRSPRCLAHPQRIRGVYLCSASEFVSEIRVLFTPSCLTCNAAGGRSDGPEEQ